MTIEDTSNRQYISIPMYFWKHNPYLFRKVNALDISKRIVNCLYNSNIFYIGDLVQKTELELMGIQYVGPSSVTEIQEELDKKTSLPLGLKLENWPSKLEIESRKWRLFCISKPRSIFKQLFLLGAERGYITYNEVNDLLPVELIKKEHIEAFYMILDDLGIETVDD
jgi:hypothetical protein